MRQTSVVLIALYEEHNQYILLYRHDNLERVAVKPRLLPYKLEADEGAS